MSEENTAIESATLDVEQDQTTLFDQPDGQDWLLVYYVLAAEAYGIGLPVTLYANGAIVSGNVAKGADFFKYQHNLLTAGRAVEEGSVVDHLKFLGEQAYGDTDEPIDIATFKPKFIHLENARVFVGPQQPIPQEGMYWRGKLSEITAFSPGKFAASR